MKKKFCGICNHPHKPIYRAKTRDNPAMCKDCDYLSKLPTGPKNSFLERVAPLIQEITVAHLKMKIAVEKSKRTPIKKVSDKQVKINAAYSVLRKQFLKDKPYCEVQLGGCTYQATQVHHSLGRGNGNMLNTATWISICFNCHHIVETSPSLAKELGFSHNRLDK